MLSRIILRLKGLFLDIGCLCNGSNQVAQCVFLQKSASPSVSTCASLEFLQRANILRLTYYLRASGRPDNIERNVLLVPDAQSLRALVHSRPNRRQCSNSMTENWTKLRTGPLLVATLALRIRVQVFSNP